MPGYAGIMEEGERVRSGSLRIDLAAATRRLKDFQTAEPWLFALAWLRAAVAAGATRVHVDDPGDAWLRLRFDGAPYTRSELDNPFDPLFDPALGHRRRELAYGLLVVLRLKPSRVTIVSGEGKGRLRLTLESIDQCALTLDSSPGRSTELFVEGLPSRIPDRWLDEIARSCRAYPIPLRLPPTSETQPRAPLERRFSTPRLRGAIGVPALPQTPASIELCFLGVRASLAQLDAGAPRVEGWLDSESFQLDASRAAVVHDEFYYESLQAARAAADELLREAVETQAARFQTVAQSLAERAAPPSGIDEAITLWLRANAYARLSVADPETKETLNAALWGAPLFVDGAGRELTLGALARQVQRTGVIPYVRKLRQSPLRPYALWLETDADRECLELLFPGSLIDPEKAEPGLLKRLAALFGEP